MVFYILKIKCFFYLLCFFIGLLCYIVMKYYNDNVEIMFYNIKFYFVCILLEGFNLFDIVVMKFIWSVLLIKCVDWFLFVFVDF